MTDLEPNLSISFKSVVSGSLDGGGGGYCGAGNMYSLDVGHSGCLGNGPVFFPAELLVGDG